MANIFNVIKYPIGDPPTLEQLKAVPPHVFNRWRKSLGFGPVALEDLYRHLLLTSNQDKPFDTWRDEVAELRRMIARMRKE